MERVRKDPLHFPAPHPLLSHLRNQVPAFNQLVLVDGQTIRLHILFQLVPPAGNATSSLDIRIAFVSPNNGFCVHNMMSCLRSTLSMYQFKHFMAKACAGLSSMTW